MLPSNSPVGPPLGARITVSSTSGSSGLTLIGVANSIDQSGDGWVLPSEIAALRAPGTPATSQMLYRFSSADVRPPSAPMPRPWAGRCCRPAR